MRILLVAYDNDSYIHWFPQGLAYIAAVLLKAGHDVSIYNQDLHHYPSEHLLDYLNANRFDAVGVGVIAGYYQYRKLLEISRAINESKHRPYYFLGGHGPSPEPEYFMRKTSADAVIIGEGEETVVELFSFLESKKSLSGVNGIAFRNGDEIVINPRRPLIENIDSIPYPAYELFPMEYYRLLRIPHCGNKFALPLLSGRGCTFKCNFCYLMDEGFRPRSNESIIEEIKLLKKKYNISYIVFSDELLMSSRERTESLCRDFIKAKLGIKWDCNGRLNYAFLDLLKLMKESGCVFINYGIEAMDDQILKNMNKALTTKQIINGIEATLKAGISPGYNVIFGNIGENKETLKKGVDFLLKYDDGAQLRTIRPVTPYPGSPLYYYAIEKGLLKDCQDFYENKHLNSDLLAVNFTNMSDEEFYRELCEANKILIKNYFDKKEKAAVQEVEDLYFNKNVGFRGFRQT
ncbi:MAG: radical SAM protein [Candidatus Omnitrophica bacterium]|nr:radical SAM protein [Candidatus Omnitrophota bacterium]